MRSLVREVPHAVRCGQKKKGLVIYQIQEVKRKRRVKYDTELGVTWRILVLLT